MDKIKVEWQEEHNDMDVRWWYWGNIVNIDEEIATVLLTKCQYTTFYKRRSGKVNRLKQVNIKLLTILS